MKTTTIFRREPLLIPLLLVLATVWIAPHTPILNYVENEIQRQYQQLPAVKIDLHPHKTWMSRYPPNRTALYIETRNDIGFTTPLLLHMTQVVPPEWRFLFLSTTEIIEKMNHSSPVRRLRETGKLRIENVDRWTSQWGKKQPDIRELHNRLLTNISFYDQQLEGVEHLLVFRSSSIICANANRTINDYLQYDWVGAPWSISDNFGGNGGLSLRNVDKVREVLSFQSRLDETESEDRWLSSRIGLLPDANNANGTVTATFSVEDVWENRPLGYHINPGLNKDSSPDVWNIDFKRSAIYDYCPEVKIILPMRLERERCANSPRLAEPVSEGIDAIPLLDNPASAGLTANTVSVDSDGVFADDDLLSVDKARLYDDYSTDSNEHVSSEAFEAY